MDFKLVRVVFLLVALLPGTSQAQLSPWAKALPEALGSSFTAKISSPFSTQLQRRLAAAKAPDIRLSVARLDHAACLELPMHKRPHSTAFLFKTIYKNRPEIWAATAGHTGQLGEKMLLTFYNGKKEIPVRGTIVQMGPALLSDASLIKLETSLPPELQPFTLSGKPAQPREPLETWGYASNKLYHITPLNFEKDNTRFIRTDFPATQRKRSGLCGGPLLNAQHEVLGIHCGSSPEDKSYASNIRIIPYLLQAYHEGSADIPVIAKHLTFGSIHINERILYVQCTDEQGHLLNQEDIYDQLPQSLLLSLYQDPEVRYMRFVLGAYLYENPVYRVLVYDKKTGRHHFEPFLYR